MGSFAAAGCKFFATVLAAQLPVVLCDTRAFLPLRRSRFVTAQLLLNMTIAFVNEDGTFEIKDVQAGKPKLVAGHPVAGRLRLMLRSRRTAPRRRSSLSRNNRSGGFDDRPGRPRHHPQWWDSELPSVSPCDCSNFSRSSAAALPITDRECDACPTPFATQPMGDSPL